MIISKTPLRISLAGGSTDRPEFYEKHGYGAVVSTAIDKYIRVSISNRYDGKVLVYAGGTCELVDRVSDVKHNIIRECLRFAGVCDSVEVHVQADLPGGSGLGSSSALTVGMLTALAWRDECFVPEAAYMIERTICGNPVGKQDHYIADTGGLHRFTFKGSGPAEEFPIGRGCCEHLNTHLMLFDTGLRRSASDVLSGIGSSSSDQFVKMIRAQVYEMVECIWYRGDVGKILHRGWLLKRSLSDAVSNPQIDAWYQTAMDAGATGGKICGAGGGGFLLLWVLPDLQGDVATAIGLPRVNFRTGAEGSKIVYEDT